MVVGVVGGGWVGAPPEVGPVNGGGLPGLPPGVTGIGMTVVGAPSFGPGGGGGGWFWGGVVSISGPNPPLDVGGVPVPVAGGVVGPPADPVPSVMGGAITVVLPSPCPWVPPEEPPEPPPEPPRIAPAPSPRPTPVAIPPSVKPPGSPISMPDPKMPCPLPRPPPGAIGPVSEPWPGVSRVGETGVFVGVSSCPPITPLPVLSWMGGIYGLGPPGSGLVVW